MSEKDGEPPDKRSTYMDYSETFKHKEWEASRLCADEMMRDIPGLNDGFVLDQITLGDGQCFMTSVIQQLRRPDVNTCLTPKWQQYSRIMDPRSLKFQVKNFMQSCQHKRVKDLKMDWKNFTGMTFEAYWGVKHIMKKSTWADHLFIQSAAWCLKLDFVIHQNIPPKPVTIISGNIEDSDTPCFGPQLHIGYLVNRHYQSLLPKNPADVIERIGTATGNTRKRRSTAIFETANGAKKTNC